MKHIKITFSITICVFLTILCCSCGLVGEQKYVCEADNVDKVQIVKLDNYIEGEYRFDYTTLSEISDISLFIDNLNNVEHSINWGEPGVLSEGNVVIKIDYNNGDYDLLSSNAQWFNRNSINQTGYFFFNEGQFEQLISEWCPEAYDDFLTSIEITE